jgi:hypothetical protein
MSREKENKREGRVKRNLQKRPAENKIKLTQTENKI